MKDYQKNFKGKKITVMGLGILGRGLGYTKFLAECGADLIVTDLKSKEQLVTSVKALAKFKNIKFVLGEHRLEDFRDRDMIVKAAGVPLDSIYIKEARRNNIPIEMDVSLFSKCAPKVMIIGVTGTRGKSMTTTLIYEILKANASFIKIPDGQGKNYKSINVYPGGNLRGVATLPLLKKIKDGDIVVCELDSWQLQGFGDSHISPHISVFTTFMPDHMNYYKGSMEEYFDDKANIFKYQKKEDHLIIRPNMKEFINNKKVKGKFIVINPKSVASWKFSVPGEHHRENLACAVKVAEIISLPEGKIKKVVREFKGLEGRSQLLRVYKGVKIYNDNNATTPEALIVGVKALSDVGRPIRTSNIRQQDIILICGGSDKKVDLTELVKTINKNCKFVSLIAGTGTDVLLKNYKLKIPYEVSDNLKDVVKKALAKTKKGDVLLFSPAFASFGMFNNEYERNDLFIKIIKGLQ